MAYVCGVARRNPISIRYRECKTEFLGLDEVVMILSTLGGWTLLMNLIYKILRKGGTIFSVTLCLSLYIDWHLRICQIVLL